ncbi:MAG: DNA mismatch repair endonuclease MutL [Oscillospiraceae bacterium]|nr:DNA mismatch repair endonuclease MutL [Oscillospiraceae bacterium]
MSKIQILSAHVADMIAAGEVVERPASVIKELLENSIDAGASSVTVEIKGGGMTFMRVTDNGCGMSPQDAATAFLRHATSKLRDERGLEAIGTLGFRGEALAAISSVSRIELLTKEPGASEGVSLTLEGGNITSTAPAGCPDGTTIIVRDLFFNTPARLKFMKTDRAEASNITSAVTKIALSHPELALRYIKDGREELRTPGDGRTDSVIYSVFGRDFAKTMLKAESSDGDISVSGYVSAPAACRGNRSNQFFFVNGRNIKSKTFQAALEQAYKNSLFTGRFPSCILYITMSPAAVDVNVHPAKTEVRFLNERKAFDGVYYAALSALESENPGSAEVKLTDSKELFTRSFPSEGTASAPVKTSGGAVQTGHVKPRQDFFKTVSADSYRSSAGFKTSVPPVRERFSESAVHDSSGFVYGKSRSDTAPAKPPSPVQSQENFSQQEIPDMPQEEPFRYIGEAMDTYLIVEAKGSLWLIDKHAAHERMNFDRLKSSDYAPMRQQLIAPIVCRLPEGDIELLQENTHILDRFGIEAERFGEGTVAVRQLPSDVENENIQALLEELCDDLRAGGTGDENARIDNIMHTMACKSAIKAGKRTDPSELDGLIKAVLTGQVRYCPHGRPVAVELTKSTLDKSFKWTQ